MEIITKTSAKTFAVGQDFGADLLKISQSQLHACIICLRGDLGSGKTTFVQGLAKGLGIPDRIISPTFVLMRQYGIMEGRYEWLYHIDLYKLGDDSSLGGLGIFELFTDSRAIVAIEWPEKIEKYLPKQVTNIYFKTMSTNKRAVEIKECF